MYQTYPFQYNPPPTGVQPQVVIVTHVATARPPAKYTDAAAVNALRLSCLQILSGIACVIFQAVATALKRRFEKEERRTYYSIYSMGEADVAGTGIWVGILMLICGVVGLFAAKENKRGKIGAHLGLNIVMLVIAPALIGTTSPSIAEIGSCLDGYRSLDSSYGYVTYPYSYGSSTTTIRTFLGRPVSDGCQTPFFKGWMAMVCLLLIIAVVNFVVALVLLVMNSKVLCCSSCCTNGVTEIPQQQVMYNAGYAPGQPCIIPLGYPTPSYAPNFNQIGQPSYYPQQQWVQPMTSMGAASAQSNPPAREEKSSPPPPSYDEQFAASAAPVQQM